MAGQLVEIRILYRGADDVMKHRIMNGNRIVKNFKSKLGIGSSEKEDLSDSQAKKVLTMLRKSYRSITKGVLDDPKKKDFTGDGVISSFTEFCLVTTYMDAERHEEKHFKLIGELLKDVPLWREFLEPIKGVGVRIAAVILSEIDIHKARHPSSLWRYAGLDVGEDGLGRSRRAEHLVDQTYINKEGVEAVRKGIAFNPKVKTKLMGVLADSFIKQKNEVYYQIYLDYKHRMENHAVWGAHNDATCDKKDPKTRTSKARRSEQAKRYMIKMFLKDLYVAWRTLENLPVSKPYAEAFLGRPPHGEEEVAA